MRTLLQRKFVADATQKRRSMSQATCFLTLRRDTYNGRDTFGRCHEQSVVKSNSE